MQIKDKWKDGYSFGATQTFNYWEDSNIKYTAVPEDTCLSSVKVLMQDELTTWLYAVCLFFIHVATMKIHPVQ